MPSPSSFVRSSQARCASLAPSGTIVPPPPAGGVFPIVGAIGSRMKFVFAERSRSYGKIAFRSSAGTQNREVKRSGN